MKIIFEFFFICSFLFAILFCCSHPTFSSPHFPDPQEQVQQQQERIEELEEALRESVRITAQREIAVAERQALVEAADEKVISNVF